MKLPEYWFVSDLHGKVSRYEKLFSRLRESPPEALFMGGDLLPHEMAKLPPGVDDFLHAYFFLQLSIIKDELGQDFPEIFLIPGNDDPGREEATFKEYDKLGLIRYLSMRTLEFSGFFVTGYPFVPPTPFQRKDWEKYDVSRFVDPGCVPPTEGCRSVDPDYDPEYATIARDLEALSIGLDMDRSILLMHSPPYQTRLDRAALDGMMVDHVPLDVHVGSIAIQRFIEEKQPLLTLHGHIHESSAITGSWKDSIGRTQMLSAAWNGPELALVRFDPSDLSTAQRELI